VEPAAFGRRPDGRGASAAVAPDCGKVVTTPRRSVIIWSTPPPREEGPTEATCRNDSRARYMQPCPTPARRVRRPPRRKPHPPTDRPREIQGRARERQGLSQSAGDRRLRSVAGGCLRGAHRIPHAAELRGGGEVSARPGARALPFRPGAAGRDRRQRHGAPGRPGRVGGTAQRSRPERRAASRDRTGGAEGRPRPGGAGVVRGSPAGASFAAGGGRAPVGIRRGDQRTRGGRDSGASGDLASQPARAVETLGAGHRLLLSRRG